MLRRLKYIIVDPPPAVIVEINGLGVSAVKRDPKTAAMTVRARLENLSADRLAGWSERLSAYHAARETYEADQDRGRTLPPVEREKWKRDRASDAPWLEIQRVSALVLIFVVALCFVRRKPTVELSYH